MALAVTASATKLWANCTPAWLASKVTAPSMVLAAQSAPPTRTAPLPPVAASYGLAAAEREVGEARLQGDGPGDGRVDHGKRAVGVHVHCAVLHRVLQAQPLVGGHVEDPAVGAADRLSALWSGVRGQRGDCPRDQNREGSGEGGDHPLADPVVVKVVMCFFSSGRDAELLGKVPWLPRTENL